MPWLPSLDSLLAKAGKSDLAPSHCFMGASGHDTETGDWPLKFSLTPWLKLTSVSMSSI